MAIGADIATAVQIVLWALVPTEDGAYWERWAEFTGPAAWEECLQEANLAPEMLGSDDYIIARCIPAPFNPNDGDD